MLPIPESNQCFNYRQTLGKPIPFCPHCGAPLPLAGSLFKVAGRGLGVLFCICGAVFCVLLALCCLFAGIFITTSADVFFGGLILLIIAGLCAQGWSRLLK
jgi:hypothetical protein